MSDYSYTLHTLLDLTKTGVLRDQLVPIVGLKDLAGQNLGTKSDWTRSRNQQRNWETIIQLLSLRTQPTVTDPIKLEDQLLSQFGFDSMYGERAAVWSVTFSTDNVDVFRVDHNPIALLQDDFDKIPMVAGLTETVDINPPLIITSLAGRNTVFTLVLI